MRLWEKKASFKRKGKTCTFSTQGPLDNFSLRLAGKWGDD